VPHPARIPQTHLDQKRAGKTRSTLDASMMRYSDGMMVRMQIQFTEEQAASLRAESQQRGVSISSIVRERCAAASPVVPSRTELMKNWKTFSSGIPDLARNHDEYLADAYADWERE
jgi:hypothetical protein